jgi:hypothetical protein
MARRAAAPEKGATRIWKAVQDVISMRAMPETRRRFYFWYYAFPKPLAEEG